MKLIFATQNQHKRDEVQQILGSDMEIVSLPDLNFHDELPETHNTLEENAAEKAGFIFQTFSMNCFAEDTGLAVEALNGEPGVFSARYGGEGKNSQDNIKLVLEKIKGIANRRASFRTVVCLIWGQEHFFFEGIIHGMITTEIRGASGFGYDPIFIPEGMEKTFAEMTSEEKNQHSHRSKAILSMKDFLERINLKN